MEMLKKAGSFLIFGFMFGIGLMVAVWVSGKVETLGENERLCASDGSDLKFEGFQRASLVDYLVLSGKVRNEGKKQYDDIVLEAQVWLDGKFQFNCTEYPGEMAPGTEKNISFKCARVSAASVPRNAEFKYQVVKAKAICK